MSLSMEPQKVRYDGKAIFYRSNGTGRDSYIVRNNGGLLSQSMLRSLECKGERKPDYIPMRLGPNVGGGFRRTLPQFGDKFVHYHSDGTGRDSYVGWNHGGRIQNFSSKNTTESLFRGTLRSYAKMPSLASTTTHLTQSGSAVSLGTSAGFDFTNTNFYLSQKQLQQKNETHNRQVRDAARLSRPKTALVPSHSQASLLSGDPKYTYYETRPSTGIKRHTQN